MVQKTGPDWTSKHYLRMVMRVLTPFSQAQKSSIVSFLHLVEQTESSVGGETSVLVIKGLLTPNFFLKA